MIEAGAELLRRLDEAGVDIPLALWLFLEDQNEWKLYFWSSMVASRGPIELYRLIQKSLDEMGDQASAIPFSSIGVMNSNDRLARAFREEVDTDDGIFERVRGVVAGHIVEDSLVYRSWTDLQKALEEVSRSITVLEQSKLENGDRDLSYLADAKSMHEVAKLHLRNGEPKQALRAIQHAKECVRMGGIELENVKKIKAWSRAALENALAGKPDNIVAPR